MKTIPKMYERICDNEYICERLQKDIESNDILAVQFSQNLIDNIYVLDIEEIISRGINAAEYKPREIVLLYETLPDRYVICSLFSNLTEASAVPAVAGFPMLIV